MNRFPKIGDFVLFKYDYLINSGLDQGTIQKYFNIPKGTLGEILKIDIIETYKPGFVDIVPYVFMVGINDTKILNTPFILRLNYTVNHHKVTLIPGDSPETVKTLYANK